MIEVVFYKLDKSSFISWAVWAFTFVYQRRIPKYIHCGIICHQSRHYFEYSVYGINALPSTLVTCEASIQLPRSYRGDAVYEQLITAKAGQWEPYVKGAGLLRWFQLVCGRNVPCCTTFALDVLQVMLPSSGLHNPKRLLSVDQLYRLLDRQFSSIHMNHEDN